MKVLTNLDLCKNQLLQAVLHNLASDPGTPVEGQIYYDTANHVTKIYAHAAWETVSVSGHTHTYIPLATLVEQGDLMYASAAGAVAVLTHGAAGQVLQSGGNAANPSWLTLGTMAAATATDYLAKALGTAHGDLLYFTAAATPAVLAHGTDDQVLQTHADGTIAWVSLGSGAFATIADYIAKALLTEQGSIIYASAASTPAELLHGNAGQVLQSGGNAANPSWLTLGSMAAATATDYIAKAIGTAKGDLIGFSAAATPGVLALGTDGKVLMADAGSTYGFKWETLSGGHTQNTDSGTTGATFSLDSDAGAPILLKNNAGVLELKNAADNAYMDLVVKDLTVQGATITVHSETVTFHDNILMLDDDAATAGATAGLAVERGSTGADASLLWLESGSCWTAGIVGSEKQIVLKYACDVGDAAAETIDVVHNLNTRDVTVAVITKASTYDAVMCDWQAKDANTVTLVFAVHPGAAEYRCVVTG
jgi:hypothetical protein